MGTCGSKIRLLRVWEILKAETDENHSLGTMQIIRKLQAEGFKCNRVTLYDDIEILNNLGYEVICVRSTSNRYYVIDRDFDIPEIRILIDAVQAASFITESKTSVLVDKLAQLAGSQKGEVLKKNVVEFKTVKGNNEHIYYNVLEITEAIERGKQIEFYYFDYGVNETKIFRPDKNKPDEKKRYVVNPLATSFDDNKYYLLCYSDNHKNLTQYRIDRMDLVNILDDKDVTPNDNITEEEVQQHKKSLFSMYGGKTVRLRFEANKNVIGGLYDKFGKDISITALKNDPDKVDCSVKVQVSTPLIAWLIGFGKQIKIKYPQSVIEDMKAILKETLDNYDEE